MQDRNTEEFLPYVHCQWFCWLWQMGHLHWQLLIVSVGQIIKRGMNGGTTMELGKLAMGLYFKKPRGVWEFTPALDVYATEWYSRSGEDISSSGLDLRANKNWKNILGNALYKRMEEYPHQCYLLLIQFVVAGWSKSRLWTWIWGAAKSSVM